MKKIIVFLLLLISTATYAQLATIDPTFAAIATDIEANFNKTFIQADGKIIATGWFKKINGIVKNGIARFNANGSLDTTFISGTGFTDSIYQHPAVYEVKLLANGKIIVCGGFHYYNGTPCKDMVRLNSDGSLDATFNIGSGPSNIDNWNDISSCTEQADGKLLVGGAFTTFNGIVKNALVRLNVDGSIDNTFNNGGIGLLLDGVSWQTYANVNQISIQTDQKILVLGNFTSYNGVNCPQLIRLNADGTLDNSFTLGVNITTSDYLENFFLLQDGRILLTAFINNSFYSIDILFCLNSNGSIDNTFENTLSNIDFYGFVADYAQQNDGKILLVGWFDTYQSHIIRLNLDGSIDYSFKSEINPRVSLSSVDLQNDKIIISWNYSTEIGDSIPSTLKRLIPITKGVLGNFYIDLNNNCSKDSVESTFTGKTRVTINPGNIVKETNAGGAWFVDSLAAGDYTLTINNSISNWRLACSPTVSFTVSNTNEVTLIPSVGLLGIAGKIFFDENLNCVKDSAEANLNNQRIIVNPGNIIAETNYAGQWHIDSLAVGNYTISLDTLSDWHPTCTYPLTFSVIDLNSFTIVPNIALTNPNQCTKPYVNIYSPFLRRCFSNQIIYIRAGNNCNARETIYNAYTIVELDPMYTVNSASHPYTSLGNNKYRFYIGTLHPCYSEDILISCTISCAAFGRQTLCSEATLYPVEDCVYDTISAPFPIGNVNPCNTAWDKSSLSVDGFCTNGNIIFTVTNNGSATDGNMTCYAPIRIYIDAVLTRLDSVLLAGGQTATYTFAADGRTWRLEADQHPLHPGNSRPNATVERCGSVYNWTPNLVNALPHDDADPFKAVYCGIITGSYDPNDKTGFPLGIGTEHNVLPNGDLEYLIRFQNTGNDTAFTVVIRDTLSPNLDIFSITSGISSHKYNFRLYGPRVAEWTFNNILLPDSTTNQLASNGFVKFNIKQNRNLIDGTEIKNTADIYFDYNEPVITNQTLHTVDRMLTQKNWEAERTITTSACSSYSFNNVNYTNTGTYFQRYKTASTDSIITIDLTIKPLPNTNVIQNDLNLSATLSGANYQWINCLTNNSPIVSETNQNFNASANGDYAVIVTQNACSATSSCYSITTVAINETLKNNTIQIFPNPTSRTIQIIDNNLFDNAYLKITTIDGALVLEKEKINGSSLNIDISNEAKGIYFIQIMQKNSIANFKLIKN